MTLFEYMSVALSLIVALAFAEGLRGLQSALKSDRRYGIHTAWLFVKLVNPVFYWWVVWGFRDFPEFWNIGTFSLLLLIPCTIYLQLLSLVTDNPDQITNWREHFYAQRKWFFGLNVIAAVLIVLFASRVFLPTQMNLTGVIAYTLIGGVIHSGVCF